MQQILFHIPILNIPVYGYGLMLFCAFIGCTWLARRLCKREGIDACMFATVAETLTVVMPVRKRQGNDGGMVADLAIWLFVSGILGGRLVFVIQYWSIFPDYYWNSITDNLPLRIISLWDGGLVLYGALFGGMIGYFAYYQRYLKKYGVSNWKMLDIIAPCVALGVAFGRIGCLFTGCCYGNVACTTCPVTPLHFPVYANTSPPSQYTAPASEMIKRGYQTPHGFLFDPMSLEIEAVEPNTPAADAGLKPGDVIVQINGKHPAKAIDFLPKEDGLQLTVRRGEADVELPVFRPTSIGLNPTQIFETISMCLLLFFMLSYYPYKRHDGELMVILLIVYSIHRFLNEMLRTDTDPVAFGLTLSQNASIGIFVVGVILAVVVWRRPLIAAAEPPPA